MPTRGASRTCLPPTASCWRRVSPRAIRRRAPRMRQWRRRVRRRRPRPRPRPPPSPPQRRRRAPPRPRAGRAATPRAAAARAVAPPAGRARAPPEAWGSRSPAMRGIDRRLGLLFCGFLLLFAFALSRAFWLQGVQGSALRAEARSQQVTQVTVPGQRGRVLDRNGKVLAASEDAADVIATPYQVENVGQTALRLHDILGVPTPDLVTKLGDRSSGFEYLARKVDAATAARIKELEITGV